MTKTYQSPADISKEELLTLIASREVEPLCKGLVDAAFTISDWDWLQYQYLKLTRSDNEWIRKVACVCLGHIARLHRKLDLGRVMSRLNDLLKDPSNLVRGSAEDTIEGITEVWKPVIIPSRFAD